MYSPICSSFDCSLFLGVSVDRELVQEMKNGSDGLARNDIMRQVHILVVCCCDRLTERFRCILRNSLTRVSIDGLAPIILGNLTSDIDGNAETVKSDKSLFTTDSCRLIVDVDAIPFQLW
jgi:hypothetical protein